MSKARLLILISILLFVSALLSWWYRHQGGQESAEKDYGNRTYVGASSATPPGQGPPPGLKALPKIHNRVVYGRLPENLKSYEDLPLSNTPSPKWQSLLSDNLLRLSGGIHKSITVRPQESYILTEQGKGRNVESVIISVKDPKGRVSNYHAEVDSQTGEVLKTWDHTVFDDFSPSHQ